MNNRELYSLKNNKIKEIEDVSVLNPETNSDSASLKSIGARDSSLIEHITHKGNITIIEKRNSSQENITPVLICVV